MVMLRNKIVLSIVFLILQLSLFAEKTNTYEVIKNHIFIFILQKTVILKQKIIGGNKCQMKIKR